MVREIEPQLVRAVRETALGAVSQESDKFMKTLSGPLPSEMQPVHLFARNDDAALFNSDILRDMPGESTVYRATKNNGPKKYLKKILAPQYLELKIGSPVRPDFFLLVDLREFFFSSRVGGTKKNK